MSVPITKVQEIGANQNTISIPKEIVNYLKIKKGDRIIWDIKANEVIIKKLVI